MERIRDVAHLAGKRLLERFGLNVSRARPIRDPIKLLLRKAEALGAATMLDVGANIGQFAKEIRKAGYKGSIVSFEPLSAAHERLRRAASGVPGWSVAPRMALGDSRGIAKINISHNLVSSSLLNIADRSVETAPASGYTGQEEVEVSRLDDVVDPAWKIPFALKLDTQGFELRVLRGAPETLTKTAVAMVEMSLSPLYEGGASFVDMFRFFEESGFRCITLT